VGIACYIRHAEDPQAAGIAVTIIDNWQGRRLGTELLTRLLGRARQAGIHRFTALVADDNMAMAGLLRNMSANLVGRSPGTVEYKITPTPPGKHDHTSRGPLPGPCSNSVLNRPGPGANQESESRSVIIEIRQKIAGLLRVQGLSRVSRSSEASLGTRARSVQDHPIRRGRPYPGRNYE
jgi:hypothetical protein